MRFFRGVFLTVFISAVLLLSAALLMRRSLGDLLLTRLIQTASQAGFTLKAASQDFSYRALSLQGVQILGVAGRVPVSVTLDELIVRPSFPALLQRKVLVDLEGKLYRGPFKIAFSFDLTSGIGEARGSFDRLEVAEHPYLAALGVDRGQLSIRVPRVAWSPGNSELRGEFEFDLVKARLSRSLDLSKLNKVPLTIPALDKISLRGRGGFTSSVVAIPVVSLDTDLGSTQGDLTISQDGRGKPTVRGTMMVNLSERGSQLWGDWLPVLSNETIPNHTRSFQVKVWGPLARPEYKMAPARLMQ